MMQPPPLPASAIAESAPTTSPETSPLITARDLVRTFHVGGSEITALAGANFVITQGEIVAIMGPSGSGKSTCMHLLGCLDTPTSGQIILDDQDVATLDSDDLADIRNEKIGFVFQAFNLLPRQSALDNVALPLMYAGVPAMERADRAAAALEAVGLEDRMDHRPNQLSGGQMQRVAIARALVNAPLMLLADEPTGALDSRTGHEIMMLFRRLHAAGMTVVIVTHEREVANHTDRILHFRDGMLVRDEATSREAPRPVPTAQSMLGPS